MNTKGMLALMVVMAVAMTTHAGWLIEQTMTDPNGNQTTQVFYIQNNKMMIADQERIIFDFETSDMTVIMEEQGAYMKFPADMMNMMGEAAKESGTVEIRKTSETATIAGYSTTKYELVTDGEVSDELWLAEDLDLSSDMDMEKFLDMSTKRSGAASYMSTPEYQDLIRKGYPLKHVHFQKSGKTITEATNVEKQDIPNSQFEIPEGYQEMNMQQMMQGR